MGSYAPVSELNVDTNEFIKALFKLWSKSTAIHNLIFGESTSIWHVRIAIAVEIQKEEYSLICLLTHVIMQLQEKDNNMKAEYSNLYNQSFKLENTLKLLPQFSERKEDICSIPIGLDIHLFELNPLLNPSISHCEQIMKLALPKKYSKIDNRLYSSSLSMKKTTQYSTENPFKQNHSFMSPDKRIIKPRNEQIAQATRSYAKSRSLIIPNGKTKRPNPFDNAVQKGKNEETNLVHGRAAKENIVYNKKPIVLNARISVLDSNTNRNQAKDVATRSFSAKKSPALQTSEEEDIVDKLYKEITNAISEKQLAEKLLQEQLGKVNPSYIINMREVQWRNLIGIGSSAEVYHGMYKKREVAIKKLKFLCSNENSAGIIQEFKRETSTLALLQHPNLVQFIGAGVTNDGNLCILTEYCLGGTLFQLLHENKKVSLSWKQKIKMAFDISQGMNCLHSHKPSIIHRDLKSLNLLLATPLTSEYDSVTVKVTDFGLSKIQNATSAMTENVGTFVS